MRSRQSKRGASFSLYQALAFRGEMRIDPLRNFVRDCAHATRQRGKTQNALV